MTQKKNKPAMREPSREEIALWKLKAEKWDKLDKEIGKFYEDEEGNEPENEGDLVIIGEAAAMAFGYL